MLYGEKVFYYYENTWSGIESENKETRQEMKKKNHITVRIICTVVISLTLSLVTYYEIFGEPEFTKNCLKH